MKKITTPLMTTLLFIVIQAQSFAQITSFEKIYPATVNQDGTDVLQTSDGGYLIAGITENNTATDLDVKILKTDAMGDTLWSKRYGGSRPENTNGMLATNDGNFFVVGGSQSFGGGDLDVYLLKIDPLGNMLWSKTYGGTGNEDGSEITATADGNYVIVGGSNSVNYSDNNIQLTKIDPMGNVLWMKYYGGPNYESARSVKLCLDGGFIIAGKTASTYSSVATLFIVKTDLNGDTLWTKKYGGPDSYEGKSILANNDGSYTLALDDSSGARDSDVRIMKLNSTGSILWNQVYGGTQKDIAKMIQHTTDGGYIVACISRSFGWINPDFWILKLDAAGNTTWTKNYGGPGHEHCYAVRQTSDGGYITVGHTKSYTPNTEIMLIKLDTSGNVNTIQEFAGSNSINVFPNPTNGVVKISFDTNNSPYELSVCNLIGEAVQVEDLNSLNKDQTVNLTGKEAGIYFLNIKSKGRMYTKKIILE